MTHISTDFVFDGEKEGPYTESDEAQPVSVYGASKLQGEKHVLAASDAHLVVRVSWLYGPQESPPFPSGSWTRPARSRIFRCLRTSSGARPPASMSPSFWFRCWKPGRPASFHLCNTGTCTWQQWGQACLDLAREAGAPLRTEAISGNSLNDISAFLAKRPPNSAMSTAKYASFTGSAPRPWQEALRSHFSTCDFLQKYQVAACG